eukprot:CAMPEP_0197464316 /NCGR_PEP_ID=MMETSP1175-20131217/63957_1 /TAXON_ID=1003142 /ORGANISM="Triceratium dubium, Strain CCMP147" /LENGTH=379 /DNA_ID=CAMNT_0043000293 /DNA_START=158 /DNA_END=1298 /DNA_ORIENTATION=+
MCLNSEVTIDVSAEQLPMSEVKCVSHPLDGADDEPVPAAVPMSEDEDGSDSEEGYSSMSDDDEEDGNADVDDDASSSSSKDDDSDEPFHELYLPEGETAVAYTQPILFSGGMDAEECEEYYRSLEVAARAAAQREAAAAASAAASSPSRKRSPFFRRMGRCDSSNLEVAARAAAQREAAAAASAAASSPSRKRSPFFRRMGRCDSSKKIKADGDDESVSSYRTASSSASSSSGERSSVSFSESVTVHPVFTIDHFPDDVWDNTWTPRRAVKEGKRRAKIEFRYDGCDWRHATEEDGMFRDPRTGRLEHPVHYYSDDDVFGRSDEVVQVCLVVPAGDDDDALDDKTGRGRGARVWAMLRRPGQLQFPRKNEKDTDFESTN